MDGSAFFGQLYLHVCRFESLFAKVTRIKLWVQIAPTSTGSGGCNVYNSTKNVKTTLETTPIFNKFFRRTWIACYLRIF